MESLPIISMAGLSSEQPAERQATANELGRACRDIGFFYLVDHGIPDSVFEALFEDASAFFSLPSDRKEALSIKRSPHNRGYVAIQDEKLNPVSGADSKEAFNIGHDLPADHPDVLNNKPFCGVNYWPDLPGWRERTLDYYHRCLNVARTLHRGFALDMGAPEDFFESRLIEPIATLRMLRYPAAQGDPRRPDGAAGTHTDYGNVTLLKTDGVPGLEVRTKDGQWIDAPSFPGAFVCNIGDCLMRWSNDLYQSTPHRVRTPKAERYSVAFFMEADPDAMVDPRDLFPDQEPHYPPVSCSDYLAQRLNATYDFRAEPRQANR